jgi:hypothetical protein
VNKGQAKGPWTNWLEVNVPEVKHRTANIYMALAAPDARKVIDELYSQRAATIGAEGDLSIRAAIEAVAQARRGEKSKRPPTRRQPTSVTNGGVADPEDRASPDSDPEVVIGALDAGEVVNIIGQDADKRTDLLRELIRYMAPNEIVRAVIDALDNDKATGITSITLPPVASWVNGVLTGPGGGMPLNIAPFGRALAIKDLAGGASVASPIVVLPSGTDTIDLLSSYSIVTPNAVLWLWAMTDLSGFYVG